MSEEFTFALALVYYALGLVNKNSRHFLNQSSKTKTDFGAKERLLAESSLDAFSRALRLLLVIASSSYWLFASVVTGQSNYFGFIFSTLS